MDDPFILFHFPNLPNNTLAPVCGISLLSEGSMRASVNEENRQIFYQKAGLDPLMILAVRQKHTKTVYAVHTTAELKDIPTGDGIITIEKNLIPTVTVADCMPIFLFDLETSCFGVVHSGWEGTGIVGEAIKKAEILYQAKAENFKVILGPHIHSCCYTVTAERARFFSDYFTADCVALDKDKVQTHWPYRLSLLKANTHVLTQLGVKKENILDSGFCTQCAVSQGKHLFGSSRRQGDNNYDNMLAFIYFPKNDQLA
ncbi:polyphenol oxidase family protein [Treponema phagedenis]|uniref:polyphenol oxidase family protein n=1 Tax=Treponema phagedenis TaxID=162 RepID=UPI00158283F4|nr:polyphenol oxidase family protein [Treponema phagedenis]NVP23673.1 polyphenol oxidase family protein [Treponema phagedenis]QKS91812.1 polyphenol oxidase family protein [Treponema phagedenis]QLC58497.1 polyphenol oxidase family protein [Treponema phagedenis]